MTTTNPRTINFGRFQLTGKIGRGGMGEVFSAVKVLGGDLGSRRILKLLRPDSHDWDPEEAAAMLIEEGSVTASLDHKNIVKVHDVAEFRGIPYIEMEVLSGTDFRRILSALQKQQLTLPPELVAALFAQACEGLHAAHQQRNLKGEPLNIIHRDISPSNLFCTTEGVVKVIDFGIARFYGRSAHTERGLIRCKVEYASPEHLRCAEDETLDHRTDIWSIGVVAYELLTVRPLFYRGRGHDSKQAAFNAVLYEEIPDLNDIRPDLPPKLVNLLHMALERDRTKRLQSAKELAEGLREVVRDAGEEYHPDRIATELRSLGVDLNGPRSKPIETFGFDLSTEVGDEALQTIELPHSDTSNLIQEGSLQIGYFEVPERALLNRAFPLFEEHSTSLPVELNLFADPNGSLVLRLGHPLIKFHARPPAIYLDSEGKWGKSPFLALPLDCEESAFAIGHRTVRLTKIVYARSSTRAGSALVLRLPHLNLRLKTKGDYKSLAVFHIINPLDKLQVVQALLIR